MQIKKFLTLFAIVGLPPLIYILYVTFAQNHYVKLNFYGEKQLSEELNPESNLPDTIYYQVDFNELLDLTSGEISNGTFNDHFTVVSFYTGKDADDRKRHRENYKRIRDSFEGNELVQQIVFLEQGMDNEAIFEMTNEKFFCIELESEDLKKFSSKLFFNSECPDLAQGCKSVCIIDYERRIRGYFNGVMNREVDDMMGALRVLKIEYYNENPLE